MEAMWQKLSPKMRINFSGQFHAFAKTQPYEWLKSKIAKFSKYSVLPLNSRFLGLGIFREFEIRELKNHDFPPNSL